MSPKTTISADGIQRVARKLYGLELSGRETEKIQRKLIETVIDTLGLILQAIKNERKPEQKRV